MSTPENTATGAVAGSAANANSAPRTSSPIESAIRARLKSGRKALAPFLTAGFPDRSTFVALLQAVEATGADCVEIGLPFSDPIADGPTIQRSSHESLMAGITVAAALADVAAANVKLPLIAMSYLNPLLAYGAQRFVSDASAAGIRGLIVPDLPFGEPPLSKEPDSNGSSASENLAPSVAAFSSGWERVLLAAPTTPAARLKRITSATRGFLYAVTVAGVTGARRELPAETLAFLAAAKAACRRPVLAGFGISDPESARRVAEHCDGVIVGSALVECIRAGSPADAPKRAGEFVAALRAAL